jgi:predicted nucleic acid-binding protein
MTRYVLDTSVVFKWFSEKDEMDVEKAHELRSGILEGSCSILVPDLLFYELANALRFHPGLSTEDVIAAVDAIFRLEFDVRTISGDLAADAVKIAYSCNTTVYDACFLALAKREKATLVTADYRFYERVKGTARMVKLRDLAARTRGRKTAPGATLRDFRGTVPSSKKGNFREERARAKAVVGERLRKQLKTETP